MEWPHQAARDEAIRWAADLASDPDTVYLDTETTGFGSVAEIIDIAIVDASGVALFDRLVRPVEAIPAGASAIHGIFDHHVAAEPGWMDLYEEVFSLLAGRPVVIYNAPYDRDMLRYACERHELAWDAEIARWECAMRQFAKYRAVRNPRRGGWKWHSLDVAVQHFGGQPGGHRALRDALACREVVEGMARLA